ncbi:MAG: hypothetical protein JSR85_07410 [Proteobacteria bacterium]|nr:hypothetical protein [Pseudomonadota bacterium]
MKSQVLSLFFLSCLWLTFVYAEELPDVSLRFHAQWDVGERGRERLIEKYGVSRVRFDPSGQAIPSGLSPEQLPRWMRLYELCMRDGCYYCDANEGSCESGTCGPRNASCKPYLGPDGFPKCGIQCADYAFTSTLI